MSPRLRSFGPSVVALVVCAAGCGSSSSNTSGTMPGDGGATSNGVPAIWSSPTAVVSGLGGCNVVAVDASRVYWASDDGHVESNSHGGGDRKLLVDDHGGADDIAIDEGFLYWLDFEAGTVVRLPKEGGSTQVLATDQEGLSRIAVDDTHVYWTTSGSQSNTVARVAKTGGALETLASDLPSPEGIAADSTGVYVAANSAGTILRMSAGGAATTLASGVESPNDVAVDATHVYWTGPGKVGRIGKSGGKSEVLVEGLAYPAYVLVRDGYAYFSDADANRVLRVATTGGALEVIASNQSNPHGVAVHEKTVYWCNNDDGTLMKATR